MVDLKKLGSMGGGIRKAGQHYADSFGRKQPTKPTTGVTGKSPAKAPGLTATQRTQAAGNAVRFREMARRNATPGMTAQQANELERQSGLKATLPKSKPRTKTTTTKAKRSK